MELTVTTIPFVVTLGFAIGLLAAVVAVLAYHQVTKLDALVTIYTATALTLCLGVALKGWWFAARLHRNQRLPS